MYETVRQLIAKIERQTGTKGTVDRLERAIAFLEEHDLEPREVRFEDHADRRWNERRTRKPLERLAVIIGSAKDAGSQQTWWIVPNRRPREYAVGRDETLELPT